MYNLALQGSYMDDLIDFEREGFFKVDSLHVPEYVEANFGNTLKVYYQLNKIAWSLQYKMGIPKPENDFRRAWCAVLYARTLTFVQAAVMLATKGMKVQANTQHRCALETLFKLGALSNDDQFIIDYDLAERKDHIRQGRAFVAYLNRRTPKDKALIKRVEASCQEKESDFLGRLKAHRPKLFEGRSDKEARDKFSVTTEQYARKADRLDLYDLHYRMGSAAIHSDAKSLEDGHFELNEDGTVKEIKNEPNLEDLHDAIISYCLVIFDAIRFVGKTLNYTVPEDELQDIEKTLDTCHKDAGSVPK